MPNKVIQIEIPNFLPNGTVFKTAIESFNWPENRIATNSAGTSNASELPPRTLVVTRVRDKNSPAFHQSATATKHFAKLTITINEVDRGAVRQRGKYVFSSVVFARYETGAAANGRPPIETFTLDFVSVEFSNGTTANRPAEVSRDQYDVQLLRRL